MDTLLQGDLNTITLLAAIIVGIFTKRIIPWWIHDEVVQKLKAYEEAAPELITQIRGLMDIIQEQEELNKVGKDVDVPYKTIITNKKRK